MNQYYLNCGLPMLSHEVGLGSIVHGTDTEVVMYHVPLITKCPYRLSGVFYVSVALPVQVKRQYF